MDNSATVSLINVGLYPAANTYAYKSAYCQIINYNLVVLESWEEDIEAALFTFRRQTVVVINSHPSLLMYFIIALFSII